MGEVVEEAVRNNVDMHRIRESTLPQNHVLALLRFRKDQLKLAQITTEDVALRTDRSEGQMCVN